MEGNDEIKWRFARKKPVLIRFREVQDKEEIETREGKLFAYPGEDYIIKGVAGEIYPIKKKIFHKTYTEQSEGRRQEIALSLAASLGLILFMSGCCIHLIVTIARVSDGNLSLYLTMLGSLFCIVVLLTYPAARSEREIKQQLVNAREDLERDPSHRTKGYIEALQWVLQEET